MIETRNNYASNFDKNKYFRKTEFEKLINADARKRNKMF